MRNQRMAPASTLLGELDLMLKAGASTAEIVDQAAEQLRVLVEQTLCPEERADYYRRRLRGEPILAILRDLARRE